MGIDAKLVICNFVILIVWGEVVTSYVVDVIPGDLRLTRGEGLYWDVDKQVLIIVDIEGPTLYRYHPQTLHYDVLPLGEEITFAIPVANHVNKYLVTLANNLSVLTWDPAIGYFDTCTLFTVEPCKVGNKWNDGKADALGRLWAGSKGPENSMNKQAALNQGALYQVDTTQSSLRVKLALKPVSNSNGLIFADNNTVMYYIDTSSREVSAFDFNLQRGTIRNRRTIFKFGDLPGDPDGMTLDTHGNIWVAANGGGMVLQIDPVSGQILRKVELPSTRVDDVVFGGPNLDTLFVSSQRSNLNTSVLSKEPLAGSVFTVNFLDVKGLPGNPAILNTRQCLSDL